MAKRREDILIIGGGLIGLCLAPVLGKLNYKVSIIDQNLISSGAEINKDTRTIAISQGTKIFLEKYGLWKKISSKTEPIKIIKVLNRNDSSKINFDIDKTKKPMGYIIEHIFFKKKLLEIIKSYKNIKLIENVKIEDITTNDNYISVNLNKKTAIHAKLAIAADGKFGLIKNLYKIPTYKIEYGQSAIVSNFVHSRNHNNTAYEIFLSNGPLATLPMQAAGKNYQSSMIWSEKNDVVDKFLNYDSAKIKNIIEKMTAPYLGKIIKIQKIKTHSLSAHICRKFYDKRIAFVGDTAHSIHPIAGQGWNLGMRDIKCLVECLEEYSKLGLDIGSQTLLKKFNDNRFADVSSMLLITHSLNKIFSNNSKFLHKIRSVGFKYIDGNRNIVTKLVNYAMGVNL